MTPDRIAELRAHAEEYEFSRCSVLIECLDEIERLQQVVLHQDGEEITREAEIQRLQAALATQETLAEAIVHLAILESADAETRGWNAAVEACAVKCHRGVWTAEVPPPYESGYRAGYDAALLQAQEAIRALLKPTTKESM